MSNYVRVVMMEVDEDGQLPLCDLEDKEEEKMFVRYGIINRKNKNRVVFSTRSHHNNNMKFYSMIGEGEDEFDEEEFRRELAEKQMGELEAESEIEA